jgi:hypothetical protein
MVVIVWVEEEVDVWIEEKLYLRWEDGEEVMMWMNDEAARLVFIYWRSCLCGKWK